VPDTTAVLLDVYRTVLHVEFGRVERTLAEAAGVSLEPFHEALGAVAPQVTIGRLTMAQALDRALRSCGTALSSAAITDLVRRDGDSLLAESRVYDDVVPVLSALKSLGIRVAFVSNCVVNTRPILVALGLAELVDATILSCEVGAAKPSGAIFEHALTALGVERSAVLLIDDQPEYCDGAMAFGARAIQIARDASAEVHATSHAVIHSLDELLPMLTEAT